MKTARFDKLVEYVRDTGVVVRHVDTARFPAVPDSLWQAVGAPESMRGAKLQGLYDYPGGLMGEKPTIRLGLPPKAPEWLRVGILAHEYGHHVTWLLGTHPMQRGPWLDDVYYEGERDASWHGYEVLRGLGINVTSPLRSVLNMSIESHGTTAGIPPWLRKADML